MKNRITRLSAVVCVLVLAVSAIQAQHELSNKELPNFHKVSDHLYRGAQPLEGGFRKLSELGTKTVINLRGPDDRISGEQKETESAGLRYFNIPMPGLSAPSDEQVARVMAIINELGRVWNEKLHLELLQATGSQSEPSRRSDKSLTVFRNDKPQSGSGVSRPRAVTRSTPTILLPITISA